MVLRQNKKSGTIHAMHFTDAVTLLASCLSCRRYNSRIEIAAALVAGEVIETNGYKYLIDFKD
jgi:hypothetical protein